MDCPLVSITNNGGSEGGGASSCRFPREKKGKAIRECRHQERVAIRWCSSQPFKWILHLTASCGWCYRLCLWWGTLLWQCSIDSHSCLACGWSYYYRTWPCQRAPSADNFNSYFVFDLIAINEWETPCIILLTLWKAKEDSTVCGIANDAEGNVFA